MVDSVVLSPHNLSLNEDNLVNMQFADPKNDSFIMSVHMKWINKNPLNIKLLNEILNILTKRHESLRYSYHINPTTKRGYKIIHDEIPKYAAEVIHFEEAEDSSMLLVESLKNLGYTLHDLGKPPMLKVFVVYSAKSTYLVIAFHHIICDVVTFVNFMKELEILYLVNQSSETPLTLAAAEETLGGPALPYSEYTRKERESFKAKLEGLLKYYGEKFKRLDKSPCFLQTNNPANKINYSDYKFNLTPSIQEFFQKRKLNLSKLILTVYQIAIYQTLNLKCVSITTLFHNRTKDILSVNGYVANEHAWIEEVNPGMKVSELYEKNLKSAAELRKFMDIDSLAILQHFKTPEFCPIPRFKLNFVPRTVWNEERSQIFEDVTKNGDYERLTWFGERYRIKFGILVREFQTYFNFRFWRVTEIFKDDMFEALKGAMVRIMDSLDSSYDKTIEELIGKPAQVLPKL